MSLTAMKPKNAVESFREVIQDLLVPELKSMKVSLENIRTEAHLRDEKYMQAIQHLSEKLDYAIDIRERLAAVEAKLHRVS